MLPVDPLTATIGFLVWMAFRKQAGTNFGQMTPEREELFRNAMEFLKDPARMNELAAEFQKEGLKFQAFLLRKRAEWRARPADVRLAHDKIFAKAMASENVKGILDVAKAFEEMTATVKAKQLRDHATEVRKAVVKAAEEALKAKTEPKKAIVMTRPVIPEGVETKNTSVGPEKTNGIAVNGPTIVEMPAPESGSAGAE